MEGFVLDRQIWIRSELWLHFNRYLRHLATASWNAVYILLMINNFSFYQNKINIWVPRHSLVGWILRTLLVNVEKPDKNVNVFVYLFMVTKMSKISFIFSACSYSLQIESTVYNRTKMMQQSKSDLDLSGSKLSGIMTFQTQVTISPVITT